MLRNLAASNSNGTGILGTHLVGVLASDMPSGFALPGLLNNDVSAGDPAGCLYRVEITSWPSAGILTVDENGAFSFTGAPDGTYTGSERVSKFDPALGLISADTTSYQMTVGAGATVNLTAASSSQANTSSTGAVTVTPGAKTVNLIAADCTQTATSTAAAVTITPGPKTINLTGAACTQTAQSTSAVVVVRPPVGNIDVALVGLARNVVFEGSGSRVVPFDSSGSRVRFNPMSAKVPLKFGSKWTVDRDPDEESYYAADITDELTDRNTAPVAGAGAVELILNGVTLLEGPSLQVVTVGGVPRTYVVVLLGGIEGDPPATWNWCARVRCQNGERFDKTTWFNKLET